MQGLADLNYNFTSILDTLALFQGIGLGILLIIIHKKYQRNTFLLGLFLILFSLKLVSYIFKGLEIESLYPALFLIPFNFSWLLFPLFLVYTQLVSSFADDRISYWVLFPGIISFLAQLIIFLLPYETKIVIAQSPLYDLLFTFIGIVYSWIIAIWNLRLLYNHQIKVYNHFSMVEFKELRWARIFLIYSLISSVFIHILFVISPENFYFKIIFAVFDMIAIYWIAYHGIVQQNLHVLLNADGIFYTQQSELTPQPASSTMTTEEMEELMKQIDEYMIRTLCFKQKELTILDLAKALNVQPWRISNTINKVSQNNFNSYVNRFRVKEVKMLLKNSEYRTLSVEGIGNEAGFHSKSAFYAAFKKVTGTTPKKYMTIKPA